MLGGQFRHATYKRGDSEREKGRKRRVRNQKVNGQFVKFQKGKPRTPMAYMKELGIAVHVNRLFIHVKYQYEGSGEETGLTATNPTL